MHKHIPAAKTEELNALAQPANQTVYSDIKIISPEEKLIAPIINATGIITYDPSLLNNISARISGRIVKLYVRFNFAIVTKGQRIMDIQSTEVLSAQQNLIFLLKHSTPDVSLINSSKQKLILFGLTEDQITQIETKKEVIDPLPVFSPYSGHIHDIGISNGVTSEDVQMSSGMGTSSNSPAKMQVTNLPSSPTSSLTIKEGMFVQSGQALFSVYNTDQVWAILNIFPQDARLVKTGDKVFIKAETNSANEISAVISHIEPVVSSDASVIKARAYLQNADALHLKIGTLLSAKIVSKDINGMWLPRNAVVQLGQKQIVFIWNENHFITRNIQEGIVNDSLVQIISGLNRDEQVAANAQYLVDSESFIQVERKEN